jgi:hypothetical protein
LLTAGELPGDAWVQVLDALALDPDPDVAAAVVAGFEAVYGGLERSGDGEIAAAWARGALRPVLDRIGWDPAPDEPTAVTLLRARLIEVLGGWAGDADVARRATGLVDAYRADPAAVDPSLVATVLTVSAHGGDEARFEDYLARFRGAETPVARARWLATLGAFRDPALVGRALSLVLTGELPAQELSVIPMAVAHDEASRQLVFDWVLEHYEELAERVPPPSRAGFVRMAGRCSPGRLETARAFFSSREVPGTAAALERLADSVEQCTALWEAEGPAIRAEVARRAAEDRP